MFCGGVHGCRCVVHIWDRLCRLNDASRRLIYADRYAKLPSWNYRSGLTFTFSWLVSKTFLAAKQRKVSATLIKETGAGSRVETSFPQRTATLAPQSPSSHRLDASPVWQVAAKKKSTYIQANACALCAKMCKILSTSFIVVALHIYPSQAHAKIHVKHKNIASQVHLQLALAHLQGTWNIIWLLVFLNQMPYYSFARDAICFHISMLVNMYCTW